MIPYRDAQHAVINLWKKRLALYPTGSFVRKPTHVNDLDFLTLNPLDEIIKKIEVLETLAKGKKFVNLVAKIDGKPYPVNIWHVDNKNELIFEKFTRDYDKQFQIAMRKKAMKKGYLLNNTGLYYRVNKQPVEGIEKIKDIFEKLDVAYRTPEKGHLGK